MRLINCEELIRLLNDEKAKHSNANYKQMRRGLCKAIRIAHEMDNEDAEPVRHGRWIDLRESYKDVPHARCSVCGNVIYGIEYAHKYCFRCGAKMDLEVQDGT